MGVFEFVIVLVLISTVGKVLSDRRSRPTLPAAPPQPDEIRHLQDSMSELSGRLEKLEEERDFYRALLEPPDRDPPPPSMEG